MRILGVDINTRGIQAVEMDSSFGRMTFHQHHEILFAKSKEEEAEALASETPADPQTPSSQESPLSDPPAYLSNAIQELIGKISKVDKIVMALPPRTSTFRNLQIPTRDRKGVQSAVKFELEDELPFSTDDTVFDYSVVSQNKMGSLVHVEASLRRYLVEVLQKWRESGIDPDIVTTQAWAYRSLLNRVLTAQQLEAPVLMVQMGFDVTRFFLHYSNLPKYIGLSDWNETDLPENFDLAPEDPLSEAPEVIRGLITEIKQLEILTRKMTGHSISLIVMASKGHSPAELQPAFSYIQNHTRIPTQPLPPWAPPQTVGSDLPLPHETQSRLTSASALAFSAVNSDRVSIINFRKGEFSKNRKTNDFQFKVLKKPLIGLGIVAGSLFLSLVVESAVYKSRLREADSSLEKSIKSFYGQISGSAVRSYLKNPTSLKTSIKNELEKQREFSRLVTPNPNSPLDFLLRLSTSIPKGVVVDMTQFQMGSPADQPFGSSPLTLTASLTFQVTNPQTAEKLNSVLASQLNDLKRGKMEESGTGDDPGKKWKITFTGAPVEG